MQEETLQWDPISIDRVLPWSARLYILVLLFVLVLSFVRALRLAWYLGCLRNRKKMSSEGLAEPNLQPSDLANAALENRLERNFFSERFESPADARTNKKTFDVLHSANLRFGYVWQLCLNDVNAMKRSINLTLLASAFLALDRFADFFHGTAISKQVAIAATAASLAEICFPLAVGVGLCVVIYLVSMWFEGMLALRETRWNYFCARMKERLAPCTIPVANE